ncbi:MAG: glycosyltransferase [Pseudomonadota bacterium]
MRIGILQHGDFAEAFERFAEGGAETYYAQRYSVDLVSNLAQTADFVGVCSTLAESGPEKELAPGLVAAPVPYRNGGLDARAICALFDKWAIDRLILRSPSPGVLSWALRRGVLTLPIFADSWETAGWRKALKARWLARLLNREAISLVANHNIPACLSLERIGVKPEKIFPWDWPHEHTPQAYRAKTLSDGPPLIVSVGVISESKGSGDCIKAAAALKQSGVAFEWIMIGAGPFEDAAKAQIAALGLGDRVKMLGRQPHDAVLSYLEKATISVVASRHAYPEGLPMTIYETLATRTPLILTDHPMFQLFFRDQPAIAMTPERSPPAMSAAIAALLTDSARYAEASAATGALWSTIKCDLLWGDIVKTWLGDPGAARATLKDGALPAVLGRPG